MTSPSEHDLRRRFVHMLPLEDYCTVCFPFRFVNVRVVKVARRPFVALCGWLWWRCLPTALCHYHPMTSTKKSLSSKVAFASLTPNNLGTVRKLNTVLFPIKYSEQFYSEILLPEVEDFCKLSASAITSFVPSAY